ncbi:hypothetical protein HYPSUDRAFT_818130 [Hypholoma sublateritium FD-334 SS-4]|uniref:Uncharacterized protein n=1 Tax=Hypholoma sublateritium (strain FD-334 SS-4) TaxID=945553 RepID=A0A0D2NNI3_HYPSF|nr:hypothetical protein HYPSUDRAFT_818130 [Hypholoma sublateritium FD-334 SS-4]
MVQIRGKNVVERARSGARRLYSSSRMASEHWSIVGFGKDVSRNQVAAQGPHSLRVVPASNKRFDDRER